MTNVSIEAIEVDKAAMLPIRERHEWHCCKCAKCRMDEGCNEHYCNDEVKCDDCDFCSQSVRVDTDGYDEETDFRESEANEEES